MEHPTENQKFLRVRDVVARTGLSRATLWRLQHRGVFPRAYRLSPNRVGYLEAEVAAWSRRQIEGRIIAAPDLMTAREVTATYLLPAPTIRTWTKRGLLHPVTVAGGELRYRRDEVERRLRLATN
jgi:prophage regulatory protein